MKAYLMDQFGDLSFYDIPALLISMLAAAGMVALLGFALSKELRKEVVKSGLVLAAAMCFGATVGRGSLPVAMLVSAAFIMAFPMLRVSRKNASQDLFTVLALIIGVACGVKATMVAAIALVPLFILLFFVSRKSA